LEDRRRDDEERESRLAELKRLDEEVEQKRLAKSKLADEVDRLEKERVEREAELRRQTDEATAITSSAVTASQKAEEGMVGHPTHAVVRTFILSDVRS